MRKRLVSVSLIPLILVSCARFGAGPGDESSIGSAPFANEAETGRQIHQAIVTSFRIYTEPRLVGYVRRIGRSVARRAERQELNYQFTVLYDDRIYATLAPGGYVYVTTGFIGFLQNEAELAAVLAHEIAELQYRDPRFSGAQQALGIAAQAGAVVGPFFGPIGMLTAGGLVLLHAFTESRGASAQERVRIADRRALRYLSEAGHDPQGYLDLLGRFLNSDPAWTSYYFDYLSSRPVDLDRVRFVLEEFEGLPLEGRSFDVNRERFLALTHGVREMYQR